MLKALRIMDEDVDNLLEETHRRYKFDIEFGIEDNVDNSKYDNGN